MSKFGTPVMTSLQTTVENDEGFKCSGAAVAVIKDGEVIISEGFWLS